MSAHMWMSIADVLLTLHDVADRYGLAYLSTASMCSCVSTLLPGSAAHMQHARITGGGRHFLLFMGGGKLAKYSGRT